MNHAIRSDLFLPASPLPLNLQAACEDTGATYQGREDRPDALPCRVFNYHGETLRIPFARLFPASRLRDLCGDVDRKAKAACEEVLNARIKL